jgi:hypothetical protein
MCSGWSRHTDGGWQHLPGVDAQGNRPKEGSNAGQAQERRIRRLIQVEYRRIEGDAKLMEDALGISSANTKSGSGTGKPRGSTR